MAGGRVLVHVRRAGARGAAAFGQSVTGVFCPAHTDVALVSCGLERGHFLISDVPFPGSAVTVLKRPPFCPAKLGGATPGDRGGHPGVAAAVAVLLEAACGHVLLTRRATTLRHFPNVWVPPGGHLEPGEELVAAGLRELAEETGLLLEPGTFSWRLLGLWESLFPPALSRGPPRCHHIVTYLGLRSAEPRERLQVGAPREGSFNGWGSYNGWGSFNGWGVPSWVGESLSGWGVSLRVGVSPCLGLPPEVGVPPRVPIEVGVPPRGSLPPRGLHAQARLCPSPCEVSAVAWLEPLVLEAIAATEDGAEGPGPGPGPGSGLDSGSGSGSGPGSSPGELPATVGIMELSAGGFQSSQIPTGILLRRAPAHGPDLERVSTGTKFALGRRRAGPGRGDRE
ncbi:nucleoside diphosphate-linked moiety X motif 17 isoform X1 [Oenanthe melanoleuca]|uniref:nucleoside diphosphate-linked moiety X motif 17 isoform X1 n=1 Tax=Oenanthe melanoleuca TaxID=2939378 RepID=UPI0024C16554|nr:nucleoside diphosphate-linked moiety X motif 17 isoform X1 [Oenanthe melanoleuca]